MMRIPQPRQTALCTCLEGSPQEGLGLACTITNETKELDSQCYKKRMKNLKDWYRLNS